MLQDHVKNTREETEARGGKVFDLEMWEKRFKTVEEKVEEHANMFAEVVQVAYETQEKTALIVDQLITWIDDKTSPHEYPPPEPFGRMSDEDNDADAVVNDERRRNNPGILPPVIRPQLDPIPPFKTPLPSLRSFLLAILIAGVAIVAFLIMMPTPETFVNGPHYIVSNNGLKAQKTSGTSKC